MTFIPAPCALHERFISNLPFARSLALRNSLFKIATTSLAALTLSAVALATPASAAGGTWHGGGGGWHRGGGGWRGGGGGLGWAGVGLATGVIAGAALATPYYY